MVGHALGMVSGGCGNHPASPFVRTHGQQLIESAPFFERTGTLLVIQLQIDGIMSESGKSLRTRARGDADIGADSAERSLYVGELNHGRDRPGFRSTLKPPECAAAHKEIVLPAFTRGSQREVRFPGPEIAHIQSNAQLPPHLDIQAQSGLDYGAGRRFSRVRPAIDQRARLTEMP